MTRRIFQLLVLAACAALLAAPAALAQTTGADGSTKSNPDATVTPTAVEPTAGEPAPAPVDTTPTTPEPAPTVTTTTTTKATATVKQGATGPAGPQKQTSGGLSRTALAVIVAAAALALLFALIAFARWRGWSSRRMDRWRHAAGEANWRVGLRVAEFRDFLRLGR